MKNGTATTWATNMCVADVFPYAYNQHSVLCVTVRAWVCVNCAVRISVCVCVAMCLMCVSVCRCVCVCLSFPLRPSRHVRQGQSQSVPLHFQPKQFQIMFGKQQQQQQHIHSHSHTHTHTHTYLQCCDKKFVISQSNKITVLKASTHIVDAFIKTFYTARKNIF